MAQRDVRDLRYDQQTRITDLEHEVNVLTAYIVELQAAVTELRAAQAGSINVDAYLARAVAEAREAPTVHARAIYVALADEMHKNMSDRTLVTYVARIAATWDSAGTRWGSNPTTNQDLALYLSEPVEGPNEFGSAQTRRIHNALVALGVRPSVKAA